MIFLRPGLGRSRGKIPWRRAWLPTPVLLPGESPWTEKPGRLQSIGSQRVGHDRATKHSTDHSPRGTDFGVSSTEAESHPNSSLKIPTLAKVFSSLLLPPKEGRATTEEVNQAPVDLVKKDHLLTTCSPTILKN